MPWMIALWVGLVILVESVAAQTGRVLPLSASAPTNAPNPDQTSATNSPAGASERISFDTLAAFPIKVDWVMNLTNSALDTLRREGEIPALIKALNGKKVSVQGYIKPLKQDASGVTEFLLMRNHALCCQTNVPQISEWIHVRMTTGKSVPFAHERQYIVQGVLQVGELRGDGNVVSLYRLAGDEIGVAAELR